MPLFTDIARSLPATVPFTGPEVIERRTGVTFRARLGANESVFGPSPLAIEAMQRAASRSWTYGDSTNRDLIEAIAARHGLAPDQVTIGEGIDGLLGLLVRLTCQPGDAVVTSAGAYPTFNYHVVGHGAVLDTVPYRADDHEDLDALVARARAVRPKLLYICNPDNPTGSVHSAEAIERAVDAVPGETIIVLDEAYSDFAPIDALPASDFLRPNLLRFRTFSKGFGLAGARVAYAFGERDAIVQFDKIRNHFGVSLMAQAGALAAWNDGAYLAETVGKVERGKASIAAAAQRHGLGPLASATNFVAIDCRRDGAHAQRLLDAVIEHGVFIRKPGVAPLDRMIRVTAGPPEDMRLFEEALDAAIETVGAEERRSA